ncbi:MAG: nucleoside hydrolase [Acidobacteriota bacterium]|nr:nucleoside hydrolase [Acidobacteriota bacterium]
MRRLLIDTDTGSDDAVALVMALRHPDVSVAAITVVAGNVPLEQAVQNALYTVELCGEAVPVYSGAARPLTRTLETAQFVHGDDGMGDIGLPLSGRVPAEGYAVDRMIEVIRSNYGEITLVTLGPLTNVAQAILKDPTIVAKISRCVIMGGTGSGPGNVTPASEFNLWVDPEAAKIVFESGLPITLVGWDISCRRAVFDKETAAGIRRIGTELAHFTIDIQGKVDDFARRVTKLEGFDLPDPIAMAVAIDPEMAETRHLHVEVVTHDGVVRGQSVIDWLGLGGGEPNVHVVTDASREKFLAMLHASLAD